MPESVLVIITWQSKGCILIAQWDRDASSTQDFNRRHFITVWHTDDESQVQQEDLVSGQLVHSVGNGHCSANVDLFLCTYHSQYK